MDIAHVCSQDGFHLDIVGEVAEMRLSAEGVDASGFNNTLHGLVFDPVFMPPGNAPIKPDFVLFWE